METGMVVREQPNELSTKAAALKAAAEAMLVTNDAEYAAAGEFLVALKTQQKKVEAYWEPERQNAHKTWKGIVAKEKAMLDVLGGAEKVLKDNMGTYIKKQQEEARRRAAEEAKALEAQRKAEAEAILARAEAEAEAGNAERSEQLLETAAMVESYVPAAPVMQAPRAAGIGGREVYDVEVFNDALVPTHIAGICIRPVDMAALKRMAQASKGNLSIPGVRVTKGISISARASTGLF